MFDDATVRAVERIAARHGADRHPGRTLDAQSSILYVFTTDATVPDFGDTYLGEG